MISPLLDLAKTLESEKLSKTDLIALEHFQRKPEGRGFYAVAEILWRTQHAEEAIQLLNLGLERHPHYSVARVFLAQIFFQKRFAKEAWTTLEGSPTPLRTNLTAQILKLKICVIMGQELSARTLCRELSGHDFQDSEAQTLMQQMGIKPFSQLRREYAEHLQWPLSSLVDKRLEGAQKEIPTQHLQSQEPILASSDFRDRVARGFFASPISEIFQKVYQRQSVDDTHLDDLTRARLMRRQGLYQKAYDIYERLVYTSPSNELLRREFHDIRELRDNQKLVDQKLDPALADAMERVQGIDRQIAILQTLLRRLDSHDTASP
jgi:tetratricopeptide (TPR) repeat protein